MTKNILLTATAFGVLALASTASAQTISFAEVSNNSVQATVANTFTPYYVANEVRVAGTGSAANLQTTVAANHNDIRFTSALVPERAASYRVTYALSGTATPTFIAQVSAGSFSTTAAAQDCVTNKQVVTGTGAAGSSTVSFIFTVPTETVNCSAALLLTTNAFQFDIPFNTTVAGTSTVTVSASIDASNQLIGANPSVFGAADSVTLTRGTAGYVVALSGATGASEAGIDDADLQTQLALGTGVPYRTLLTTGADAIIGAGGFAAATAPADAAGGVVYANYAAAGLPAATYDLTVNATSGDLVVLRPFISTAAAPTSGTALTVATGNLSAGAAAVSALQNIGLAVNGTPTASIALAPQTYTATILPILPTNSFVTTPSGLTAVALQTVGLEGSSFLAPWVQSTNANYNTVIRVSNNSAAATGSVQLTLASPLNTPTATTCTVAQLPKLGSIAGNGELAINSADLTTCFGAFGRGDVSIVVLSLNTNLTAKLRIVNPGNIVAEQSLGRFVQ